MKQRQLHSMQTMKVIYLELKNLIPHPSGEGMIVRWASVSGGIPDER
jgi:hypothetical protein